MIPHQSQTTDGARAERGWSLFEQGAVRPDYGQATRFRVVSGSRPTSQYQVDTLARTCTCPDHRYRGAFCKHLWAALLALPRNADPSTRG